MNIVHLSWSSKRPTVRYDCVNYIALTERIATDQYGAANPNEILCRAAGSEWISIIDFRSSYYQVKMADDSKRYTAFRCPDHTLWQFCVMPMGLKISCMVWERLVDRIFRGAHSFVSAMVDDIVIYSKDLESHVVHIKEVLTKLRNAGLTAHVNKCQFILRRIKCHGHYLENEVIKMDDDKVAARKNLQRPLTKGSLKGALGLFGYYREHIRDFSARSYLLTEMLLKNKPDRLV